MSQPFWKVKSLEDMSREEWESLCDGCGKCCLVKLEDDDTGLLLDTDISCKLFEASICRCRHYEDRHRYVPDCVVLTPEAVRTLPWIPQTCAYRLIAEGKELHDWHPLVSGSPVSVHEAGMSVQNMVISETEHDGESWENHIVEWPGEER